MLHIRMKLACWCVCAVYNGIGRFSWRPGRSVILSHVRQWDSIAPVSKYRVRSKCVQP